MSTTKPTTSVKLSKSEKLAKSIEQKASTEKTEKKKASIIVFESDDEKEVDSSKEVEKEFNQTIKVQVTNKKAKLQKKDLHSHLLARPEMYMGKTFPTVEDVYVYRNGIIQREHAQFSAGLNRIFVEVVSNALDNIWRSATAGTPSKFIKININENGSVSVWNDGNNIPVGLHDTEKIYEPELMFGHLLTSTNYDDTEERNTSGKNGYGVKICNIFSTRFSVTIYNKDAGLIYRQEWSNNMYNRKEPEILKKGFPKTVEDGKNGYTLIEFTPDYERFKLAGLTSDIRASLEKIVYDVSVNASLYGVKVMYNNALLPISGMKEYAEMYPINKEEILLLKSDDCKVLVSTHTGKEFNHVSFVNGIYTKDGGIHVKMWAEAIFRPIVEKINKSIKEKKAQIDIGDVKKYFFICVYAKVNNPLFDSQEKDRLDKPEVKVDIKKSDLTKILKWGFVQRIEENLKNKELASLKNETERKRGVVRVEELNDANYAGNKKYASDCMLCVCEGDSAAGFISRGIKIGINGKGGHDYIGILPIRGKFLNVRNASIKTITDNKEVKSVIQSLGLQFDTDYTVEENFKKLRYGKFICFVDGDHDGCHITGLLYNFFHTLFPTLLQRKGFFNLMRIPMVKVTVGKQRLPFYFQHQANQYIENNKPKGDNIKYFKGLGTSNREDVKEDFGKRIAVFELDQNANDLMVKLFDKEHADYRKEWLSNFEQIEYNPSYTGIFENLDVSTFLNQELIHFSIDDCKRSIPSVLDGLKESQRKVLYSAFKRKLNYSGKVLKVAQFAGYVAEHSNYHHGEKNLIDTIIKLAQRFIGSNNMPLFFEDGNFGSRLQMGKDAADGRYIHTKLDSTTRYLFREEDDAYLPDNYDEGEKIEKEYYLPIVPTILVNGCGGGIGTGWSCTVPSYNIKEIVEWIKEWMKNGDDIECNINPWFYNFKGSIEVNDKKIVTKGVYTQTDNIVVVTEIPIGKKNIGIKKYKETLEELYDQKKISDLRDDSTDDEIYFRFKVDEEFEVSHESLGLVDCLFTSNMVLFDSNGKIKKYDAIKDILVEFCNKRRELYDIRKREQIKEMEEELKYLRNKIRFIGDIIENRIQLKNRSDESLQAELGEKKFDRKEDSYDYLLSIQIRACTGQRLDDLMKKEKEIVQGLEAYRKKSIEMIWSEELDELIQKYNQWMKEQEQHTSSNEEDIKMPKKKIVNKKK